ncbi:hypothetical protein ACHAAC_12470 [Aeromicrobium sp. CF4.19]|uniref:hypothetical protein n=1 Tax=Aeromicrobium sp. CF4.19 TaxID=3373082 RepID=UPI003EE6E23C
MSSTDDRGKRVDRSRVAIYRLTDERSQQAVLDDFRTAAMVGVLALGTHGPDGPRVVVRCRTAGDEILVDHVVRQLDPACDLVTEPVHSTAELVHPSMIAPTSEDEHTT